MLSEFVRDKSRFMSIEIRCNAHLLSRVGCGEFESHLVMVIDANIPFARRLNVSDQHRLARSYKQCVEDGLDLSRHTEKLAADCLSIK